MGTGLWSRRACACLGMPSLAPARAALCDVRPVHRRTTYAPTKRCVRVLASAAWRCASSCFGGLRERLCGFGPGHPIEFVQSADFLRSLTLSRGLGVLTP